MSGLGSTNFVTRPSVQSVRLLQRCKHPDIKPILAKRDRIHCYRNYCTAFLVSAFSSSFQQMQFLT